MNIKTIAHNWARNYMRQQGRQTRWNQMTIQEQNLFLHVRATNERMLQSNTKLN